MRGTGAHVETTGRNPLEMGVVARTGFPRRQSELKQNIFQLRREIPGGRTA
jgi:hypothetical protein